MWEFRYLVGGRELQKSLGGQLVVGENFVFLGPDWGRTPIIATILQTAGVTEVSSRVFPLWGEGELPLPGGKLKQQSPKAWEMGCIWTDRQIYREERDSIRLYIFAPYAARGVKDISINKDGMLLDQQSISLDSYGLCSLELRDLPAGRYRISMEDHRVDTQFTISHARIQTLSGNWIQCYTRPVDHLRQLLVFIIQLENLGLPIQDEFQIQLFDEGNPLSASISRGECRSDGAGRIAGELLLGGRGPFSVEIQSYADATKWCLLPVSLEETTAFYERPQTISALGDLYTWRWSRDYGPIGLAIEKHTAQSPMPIKLESPVGNSVIFLTLANWHELTIVVIDPIGGEHQNYYWQFVEVNTHLDCSVPSPFGIIVIGGFVQNQPWEGWTMALAPPALQLQVSAPVRRHVSEPLHIEIHTNTPTEIPVYLSVFEDVESDVLLPWGPAQFLLNITKELTRSMQIGIPDEMLWLAADKRMGRPALGSASNNISQRMLPPASNLVAKTSDKEKEISAISAVESDIPLRLPPQREDFPTSLYSGIISVSSVRDIILPCSSDICDYRIEAVALSGFNWSYATAHSVLQNPTFSELLLPPHAHVNDAIIGEAIISTDQPQINVTLLCNNERVTLYYHGEIINEQTALSGSIIQLHFAVKPGQYILEIFDLSGKSLDLIEIGVSSWGEVNIEGWGLQFLIANSSWPHPSLLLPPIHDQSPHIYATNTSHNQAIEFHTQAIPHIAPYIRQVAAELLRRSASHCEQESARAVAAVCSLYYNDNIHQRAKIEHQLQQIHQRLSDMFVPRRGFRLYPDQGHDPKWGEEALYHLWDLLWITSSNQENLGSSDPLDVKSFYSTASWLKAFEELAATAADAYHISPVTGRIRSARDAYRVFLLESTPARREEALWEIEKRLIDSVDGPHIDHHNKVKRRQESCYAAIALLCSEHIPHKHKGLEIANYTLRRWPHNEDAYSTSEGVALLILLHFIQHTLLHPEQTRATIDGISHHWSVLSHPIPAAQIEVESGIAPLALQYPHFPVALTHFEQIIPWTVRLYRPDHPSFEIHEANLGDRIHLSISLASASEIGDHLELYLPPALAWIEGERHEKQFTISIHPMPQNTIDIPLIAISTTQGIDGQIGIQHWGVRIFNTYQSQRGNASFNNNIVVWSPNQRRRETQQGWLNRWRKIFG